MNEMLTVAELARAKKLPEAYLRDRGVIDDASGVLIRYGLDGGVLEDGTPLRQRMRTARTAKAGSRWIGSGAIVPYGSWFDWGGRDGLIVVEGESDCWTLWHEFERFAAIGIPGVDMCEKLELHHVKWTNLIWVVRENDKAGARFPRNVAARLSEIGWTGELFELRMPDGVKDPNDLYQRNPSVFRDVFANIVDAAQPVSVAHEHVDSDSERGKIGDLCTVLASDVMITQQKWLLPHRIPMGELTLFEGDGDLGKTTVALDLCARITAATEFPDGYQIHDAAVVLIIAVEDNLSILTARLKAAGADLGRVQFVTGVRDDDGIEWPFEVPTHGGALQDLIIRSSAKMVYIDSLFDAFAEGLSPDKARDARRALSTIRAAAHATGVVIVATRHHNKNRVSAAHRGSGSSDLRNVARAVVTFARDPDDEDLRLMRNSKNNLGSDMDALTYRLQPASVIGSNGETVDIVRVEWCGTKRITADEAVLAATDPDNSSPIEEAKTFLRRELEDGPVSAKEITERAKTLGVAERTLKRAKRDLGVESVKGEFKGGWAWRLTKGATNGQEGHDSIYGNPASFAGNGTLRGPEEEADTCNTSSISKDEFDDDSALFTTEPLDANAKTFVEDALAWAGRQTSVETSSALDRSQ